MKKMMILIICLLFVIIFSSCQNNNSDEKKELKNQVLDQKTLLSLIGAENFECEILNFQTKSSENEESTKIFVELFVAEETLKKGLDLDSENEKMSPMLEKSLLEFGVSKDSIESIGTYFKQYTIKGDKSTKYCPYYAWWMIAKKPNAKGTNVYVYAVIPEKTEKIGDGSPVS